MVSTRGRPPRTAGPPADPGGAADGAGRRGGGRHEYERCRDQRVRENRERMRRLGILDLAQNLKSSMAGSSPSPKRPYRRKAEFPSSSSPARGLPPRRSSRLQNVTPVSYAELRVKRKDDGSQVSLEEGPKDEVYTDEHEKLLGTCETGWTLFVDGYNKDGVRIYDPVGGKTCHQCRQKTLGHRTHCSQCNIVQGQFCGDCLYMRYGENVLEAKMNPEWICPVCRGICNCSICRAKKGWLPTGTLYKKVCKLGFKSVAHYLIQTRRGGANTESAVFGDPVSAKHSLSFDDGEGPYEDSDSNNGDHCNGQLILLDSGSLEDKDPDHRLEKGIEAECGGDEEMQNMDHEFDSNPGQKTLETDTKERR